MTDRLSLAIALADLGLHVFPCLSEKIALDLPNGPKDFPPKAPDPRITKNGLKSATTDHETIRAWWAEHPENHIGVAAGASGLNILDVDSKPGVDGWVSLDEEWIYDTPETFAYESVGGSGRHLVYAAPEGLNLNPRTNYRGMKGVDRRAGESYVVWTGGVPKSRDDFTPSPEWLLDEAEVRSVDAFEGDLAEWYESLTPGTPNALVRRAIDRVNDDMSHGEMVSAQHEAVRLGAEGNPGVPDLLVALEDAFLSRDPGNHSTPEDQWTYKFAEALASGVEKHGGLTERVKSLPKYSASLVPPSISPADFMGPKKDRISFNRVLHALIRAGLDDATAATILWNAPPLQDWAREWGLDFLFLRIEEARENPQPERENPSLEDRKVDSKNTSTLLTNEEVKLVANRPTFADIYLAAAQSDGFAHERYTRACAWTVLSLALAFRGFIPVSATDKMGLNLWTNVLGLSGSGKSTALKFRDSVLDSLFLGDMDEDGAPYDLGADSSIEGLHEALVRRDKKPSFFGTDEASGFFKNLVHGTGWRVGVSDRLSDWYDGKIKPVQKVRLAEMRGRTALTSLTVQMFGTPDRMLETLNREQFHSGFLARFQWILDETPNISEDRFSFEQQEEIVEFLETPEVVRELVDALNEVRNHFGSPRPIIATTAALERMERAYKTMVKDSESRPHFDIIEPSLTRLARQAMRKIAAMNTMWRGETTTTVEDVLLAIQQVEEWYNDLHIIAARITASDFQRDCQEIETWIRSRDGHATRTQTMHRFGNLIKNDPRELESRLTYLEEAGRIVRDTDNNRVTYRINET